MKPKTLIGVLLFCIGTVILFSIGIFGPGEVNRVVFVRGSAFDRNYSDAKYQKAPPKYSEFKIDAVVVAKEEPKEDFESNPRFRIVSVSKNGTIREEIFFDFIKIGVGHFIPPNPDNDYQGFFAVCLKYYGDLSKIQLFEGNVLLAETNIKNAQVYNDHW